MDDNTGNDDSDAMMIDCLPSQGVADPPLEVSSSSSSAAEEDDDNDDNSEVGFVETDPVLPPPPPKCQETTPLEQQASLSSSSQQHPALPQSPSRLLKLRRKNTVDIVDMESNVSQRLVEYFCVVSSQPRWDLKRKHNRSATTQWDANERPGPQNTTTASTSTSTASTSTTEPRQPMMESSIKSTSRANSPHKQQHPHDDDDSTQLASTIPTTPYSSPSRKRPLPEKNNEPGNIIADISSSRSSSHPPTSRGGGAPHPDKIDEQQSHGNIHVPPLHNNNHHPFEENGGSTEEDDLLFHTFAPAITARYPMVDYPDNPLNPMIVYFCLPSSGDAIVHATTQYAMPRVHHFVLTLGCGRKLYGTCLTVLEEFSGEDDVDRPYFSNEQKRTVVSKSLSREDGVEVQKIVNVEEDLAKKKKKIPVVYVPKVLCLLSTWPYLTAFREYLAQLYRLAVTTNVMTAPLERYIVNLCCEIPAPPPGAYEIQLPILNSIIRFWAPPAKLPIAYTALPYNLLFECLDVDHILKVWTALLLERKVLLISSQNSILTVCAEILCSLLFPLRWSHLYVPLLPRMLCPMLDAPMPFLCGIVRENWLYAKQFVGQNHDETTVVVDLDCNTLEMLGLGADLNDDSETFVDPWPAPPSRKWAKLQSAVTESAGDVFWKARGLDEAFVQEMLKKPHKRRFEHLRLTTANVECRRWDERLASMDHAFNLAYTPESPNLVDTETDSQEQQSQWDCTQEAFLRFNVALLKDYRRYLDVPDNSHSEGSNARPSFNRPAFLSGLKADNISFVSELCTTQHFDDFLSRRMYSPGEPDLVFFDQSIDAKLNRSKLKLKKVETSFLHSAKVHKQLTKLHAVSPNEDGLPFSNITKKIPYIYEKFPDKLDTNLFCTPRPIPKMISAEFDRQAILVSKLRANVLVDIENPDDKFVSGDALQFYPGEYNPSPEVASFTVFLFVYSSLVGQDWQKYSLKRREEDARNPSPARYDIPKPVDDTLQSARTTEGYDLEDEAMDSTIQSGFLNCCDECSPNGVMISTLSFLGSSAEDAYNSLFGTRMEVVIPDYTNLSFHEDTSITLPESDVAAAEYEEAREVAAAQLEMALEVLATLSLRGLSADSDAYLSLMEACGRCGDTKRALLLIELLKKDGFVADSEVLACFVAAFAHTSDAKSIHSSLPQSMPNDPSSTDALHVDAYSRFLTKGLDTAPGTCSSGSSWFYSPLSSLPRAAVTPIPLAGTDDDHDCSSDDGSEMSPISSSAENISSSYLTDWRQVQLLRQSKKKSRRKLRSKKSKLRSTTDATPVTEMITRHLALGESLLDFVYPNLVIDTLSDSCPHCSNILDENDVVAGWNACAFQDYTTQCPKCLHRFVPRFVVTCTAVDFLGSQGPHTPLYCEYLSPWVLRKEFHHVIKIGNRNAAGSATTGVSDPPLHSGIDKILNPAWRSGTDIRATLFWNLIVCCRRYRLPFTFLLQGNFTNRLILPRKPDEV